MSIRAQTDRVAGIGATTRGGDDGGRAATDQTVTLAGAPAVATDAPAGPAPSCDAQGAAGSAPGRDAGTVAGSRSDGSVLDGRTLVRTPVDALRADEIGRVAAFARLTFWLCVFGALSVPIMDGHPVATRLLVVGLAVGAAASTVIHWLTRDPRRFSQRRVGLLVQVQELAATAAAYFFGVFSPFPAVVSLGIYIYALGASLTYAAGCWANLALGQGVLAALIIAGLIPDYGLVTGGDASLRHQILTQVNVQVVYGLAFLLGRLSRRTTATAMSDLDRTVRELAHRDALLAEAREDLERAEARLGGPGRFTEQTLTDYRLGMVIGRGAMGEVYEGLRLSDGHPVAVKLLLRSSLANHQLVARFRREARILSALSSPHVVRWVDMSPPEAPLPYVVMERLHGEDLAQRLRRQGRLSIAEVVEVVRQAAAGLDAAHGAGIIHRDLKPQNLLLDEPSGLWKILDFGVAKQAAAGGAELTARQIVGTPQYMAPEQASGGPVDRRVDLYALTVIAYRCLTGVRAFLGEDVHAVLYQVVHQMPTQPTKLRALPPQVEAMLAIGLAKRPEQRFATGAELAAALEAAAEGRLGATERRRAAAILAATPWS